MRKWLPLFTACALSLGGCPGSENGGPVEIVTFAVTPLTAQTGAEVGITWETTGARTVELLAYRQFASGDEGPAEQVIPESIHTSGRVMEEVFRTTRYVLIAHGRSTETAEQTVTVSAAGERQVEITSFFVSPTTVAPDEPARLIWSTINATEIRIDARPLRVPAEDWGPFNREAAASGDDEVRRLETTEFRLRATGTIDGVEGSVFATTRLNVFGPRPDRPRILSFTADPDEIDQGQSSTLSWQTENAATVTFVPSVGVAAALVNGSAEVSPSRTTRYEITAARDGLLDIAELTIVVHAVAGAPVIDSFEAEPLLLGQGATTRLSWTTTDATSVDVEPGVVEDGDADGFVDVTPDATTEYSLIAYGPMGEAGPAALTVTVVPVGALVISEIMRDPVGDDARGEWFEIYNSTGTDFDLTGLEITDLGGGHFVGAGLQVGGGEYVVVGIEDDEGLNGGVSVDYQYDTLDLEAVDTLTLRGGDVVIDTVAWDMGWPAAAGATIELNASMMTAAQNDASANWCVAVSAYGGAGNLGTPGAENACGAD